ncbi:MAG TPA: FAD-binding protein [Treponemataceae bacterium]|nr:FAD-binding protein [Treponemataceae bacterium]
MTTNITITVLPGEEQNEDLIRTKVAKNLGIAKKDITALVFKKKSIDARKGNIKVHLAYTVWIGKIPPKQFAAETTPFIPTWKKANKDSTVIIVGSGPAGLFAALRLLEDGIKPLIIERGSPTQLRKQDIALISREQLINENSNYCFGEGGAGTFSDGKLYTRSTKRGDPKRILEILHFHGAPKEILTDAHPHIGSDKLPSIINAMRATICSYGGEFRFHTRCTNILIFQETVSGITVETTNPETKEKTEEKIFGDSVILATGHSARDIYQLLSNLEIPGLLEAKGFAAGVRVEHPREVIDQIQYHGQISSALLPAATYKLTTQVENRGVYSFCMCPGGLIVPSATANDEIVTNGMSPSGRNTKWSNAAIVVEIRPEDLPEEFSQGKPELAGLAFQQWLEKEAKKQGKGQQAPAQKLTDFLEGKESLQLPECSYSPGIIPSRLDSWLPPFMYKKLRSGFIDFGKSLKGFVCDEAVLVAIETRTSSPVRIVRDPKTLCSIGLHGLFPAGEGSGYAGGIVSSAMDGERCAQSIIESHPHDSPISDAA